MKAAGPTNASGAPGTGAKGAEPAHLLRDGRDAPGAAHSRSQASRDLENKDKEVSRNVGKSKRQKIEKRRDEEA